jgi:hypothetical protein
VEGGGGVKEHFDVHGVSVQFHKIKTLLTFIAIALILNGYRPVSMFFVSHIICTVLVDVYSYNGKLMYRSCIALFYRKRLPQQQRDR